MLNFTHGNIFNDLAGADYVVNTINCNGIMGKGIALGFKQRFPDMFSWYQKQCQDGQVHPGNVYPYTSDDLIIYNMTTKENWWRPSEYEWVESGLLNLYDLVKYNGDDESKKLLLPPPGCGNGGLKWDMVKPLVKKHLKDLECEVVVYEPN